MRPPLLGRHVIIETNNTTARIFPSVPDVETAHFWCVSQPLTPGVPSAA